jgi:heme/copper-type cytochrome/quinol oxidase subunit 2
MKRIMLLAAGLLVLLIAAGVGIWTAVGTGADGSTSAAAAVTKKVIYMSAVEYKGGTSSEPFPTDPAPAGGGYIIKPPDATGRWETSTYRWEPGVIAVNQGDEVELWIWGVNGALHPSYIEEYVPEFSVTRGDLTVLNFTADKAGTFRIHCSAHQPSMEAFLLVLP